jgi:hypothetical protein
MNPWVPSLAAARLLHLAAWISFVGLVVAAVLLESERVTLPVSVLFAALPLAMFLLWPAVSVIGVRIRRERSRPFWRHLWQSVFEGTPVVLALFAITYFYAVGAWVQAAHVFRRFQAGSTDALGPSAVGFFALASVFVLLAAAILYGYLRTGGIGAAKRI